ncbi:MAG: hypothetical protein ACT4PP_00665 [Sporichthyaceae bacterium]
MNDTSNSGQSQDAPDGQWWFECDRGWAPLIAELEAKLRDLSPDYTIGQVKEKFGGLRYYADAGDVDEVTGKQFRGVIREAEARSYEICERCGAPGGLSRRGTYGWVKTLCPACAGTFGMHPVGSGEGEGERRTT